MKFQVFRDGKITKDFSLIGALLFGLDRIPFRSSKSITFKDGFIDCKTKTAEPAGLNLLWDVEGFGAVMLCTTRLPEREQPYILNVELARAKLMEITLKREDWSIFEEKGELGSSAAEIQKLFIQTLDIINEPAKASVFADKCLAKAMKFSEQLAARHAEIIFDVRQKNRNFTRSSIGCTIDPKQLENANYLKTAFEMFAHVTTPVSWAKIEAVKGEYDFSELDRCVEILGKRRMLLCLGPLLCFNEQFLPDWLKGQEDFDAIREASYEFVSKIVTRYARYIHIWLVIGGLNAYNYFKFSFERILDITRTACLAAREADTHSLKMIEVVLPWGEYYAQDSDTVPPLVYIDMVTQAGINYDALGVQMMFGKNESGMHIRDMMQISAMLDRYAPVPRPVHITSFSVPDTNEAEKQKPNEAGMWYKPWDRAQQAKWIEQFGIIALSKPFINSITYSALADSSANALAGAGLLTEKFEPKKSLAAMAKLQQKILQKS